MSTNSDTSAIDAKNGINNISSSNITNFTVSIIPKIFHIVVHFVMGSLVLYACKLSQSNILPTDMEYFPYTDTSYESEETYVEPIYINIFNKKVFDQDYSMKIGFPYKDDNRKNSFIEILKQLKNKDESFIKTYFISILLSLISFNYFSFNSFLKVLNSFPELLIISLGPVIMFFFIIILNICDAIYFIFLWLYYLYLFLDIDKKSDDDKNVPEDPPQSGGGPEDDPPAEPSSSPEAEETPSSSPEAEENPDESSKAEAEGEPSSPSSSPEGETAEGVANDAPPEGHNKDNLFMLCLIFCFRLWLIGIFIMMLFFGIILGGIIFFLPFVTFAWVFFSIFNYSSKMIVNGKNVDTSSGTVIKEVFMYYKNIIMFFVSIILVSSTFSYFGAMPSFIALAITIAFFVWTRLFQPYDEEDLSVLNNDKAAKKPWEYTEYLPPEDHKE